MKDNFKNINTKEKTMTALELVIKKRNEMIEKHGFTIDHDVKKNKHGELIDIVEYIISGDDSDYPTSWQHWYYQKLKRKTKIERLVDAACFLIAEIDRINASGEPHESDH